MDERIPLLRLTSGQQGGIGYPPAIVRFKKRWYAVSDSRGRKSPPELTNILWHQRMWSNPYSKKPDPYFHSQGFVWKKWHNAPQITWTELLTRYKKNRSK